MSTPRVSVVILNWNGEAFLHECLRSVLETDYSHVEVILVDNASEDRSLDIAQEYSDVKILANDANIGYAAGNNVGFQHATGKYVVTLNNDVIVDPKWLASAVDCLERDESVGIVSCRQMQARSRDRIDALYSLVTPNLVLGQVGHGEFFDSRKPEHAQPGCVVGAGGASAVYRATLLDTVGGFDERFFAYHEESDLCMRALQRGWKCVYAPEAVVYHYGSASFGRHSKTFCYLHERNRFWFMYKNYTSNFILKHLASLLWFEVRRSRAMVFKHRRGVSYARALIDGLMGLRTFAEERRANQSVIAASTARVEGFMRSPWMPL